MERYYFSEGEMVRVDWLEGTCIVLQRDPEHQHLWWVLTGSGEKHYVHSSRIQRLF